MGVRIVRRHPDASTPAGRAGLLRRNGSNAHDGTDTGPDDSRSGCTGT